MNGWDQCRSVGVYCFEVASVAISVFFSVEKAEEWEVDYIFPATELFSLSVTRPALMLERCNSRTLRHFIGLGKTRVTIHKLRRRER